MNAKISLRWMKPSKAVGVQGDSDVPIMKPKSKMSACRVAPLTRYDVQEDASHPILTRIFAGQLAIVRGKMLGRRAVTEKRARIANAYQAAFVGKCYAKMIKVFVSASHQVMTQNFAVLLAIAKATMLVWPVQVDKLARITSASVLQDKCIAMATASTP